MFFFKNPFIKTVPQKHNVLLMETNGCHGEVIGGYAKYFQDLGYNVYCLVKDTIKKENPFCRLKAINVFYTKSKKFSKLLTIDTLKRYDHIFVMSSMNYDFGEKAVNELWPDLNKHKSVYYVHHNFEYIPQHFDIKDVKHNIMLGRFKKTTFLNPHLFGEYSIPEKTKPTTFVSVGGINPKRKNHTMLLSAIEQLDSKGLDFTVFVVGSGSLKNLNPNIKKHIKLLGHLDYKDMFDYVEKANFFLPLLDDKNPDHERYIKTQVTGSTQLIYGFRKVPVINKHFAKFYSLDDSNSVLYTDLTKGMESAIKMSKSDYNKHVKSLDKTATKVYKESLKNLKDILNG